MKNDFWIEEVWRLYCEGYTLQEAVKKTIEMRKDYISQMRVNNDGTTGIEERK